MVYEFTGNQKSKSSSQLGQFKASPAPYLHYRLFLQMSSFMSSFCSSTVLVVCDEGWMGLSHLRISSIYDV